MTHDREWTAHVRVRVPSKVNLFLAVRGRRSDGYHDLVSVMQTVAIHDEVAVAMRPSHLVHHPALRKRMEVRLEHDAGPDVPDGGDNLAVRAAQALLDEVLAGASNGYPDGEPHPVTRVRLRKRIPVAAGMAGGSADAAATLVALNRLWSCDLTGDELRRVGAGLGADVPFCVTGGTALATGVGENVARVLCRGEFCWVFGMTHEPLSTAAVYRAWDESCRPSEVEPDAVLHALSAGDAEALGAALHNDLEPAALRLRPALADATATMREAGALGVVVSGSGPTVAGLARDRVHAQRIADGVRDAFDRVEVTTSPAGGPELVAG